MARSMYFMMLSICVALVLSLTLPVYPKISTIGFSKREGSALDDLWRSIPATQKAGGDSALYFKIDQQKTDAWGITFLYGCTALMISNPKHVIVAHMQEINSNACLSLSDTPTVKKFISDKLEPATDHFDADDNDENGGPTRVDLIYSSQQDGPARLDLIKTFLTDWGVDKADIVQWPGSGGSGDGEARGSPSGKAVVQWVKTDGASKGTLKVFNGSSPKGETPVFEKEYDIASEDSEEPENCGAPFC